MATGRDARLQPSYLVIGVEETGDDSDPVLVRALGQLGLDVKGVLEARLQGGFEQLHGHVRHGVAVNYDLQYTKSCDLRTC